MALGVLLLYACAGVGFLQLRSGGMLWLFTAATGGICVALLWILCKRNAAFARPFETFFSRLHWITILLIALTLRLIWVFGADATEHSGHPLKYEELAQYIYHGGGLFDPAFMRPSGPSVFYAGCYALFGENRWAPQVGLAIIGALTAVGVYACVRRITGRRSAAGLAGMLMACWPGQILYCVIIGNVVAFTFLLVFGFLLFLLSATGKSARSQYVWLLLAGIVLGLCNWVRSMTPIFLFSFALCLLLFTERIRQKLLRCVVFTIGASVFIVPAVVHNY